MRSLTLAFLLACVIGLLLAFPFVCQGQSVRGAEVVSYITAGTNVGLDTWHSFRCESRSACFKKQGIRLGGTIAIAELTKHFIHRTRPDGSDNKSFFSEHTAIAAVSQGYNYGLGLTFTIDTGAMRIAAKKHFLSDVLVGGAVGSAMGLIR